MALQHGRHLLHHIQVKPEQPIQTRALHLEHHLTAAAQAGPVHLRQRSSAERFRIQIDHFGATLAQLLFEHGLHLGKAESGNAVLQSGELRHPAGRKNVGTR